MLRNDEDCGRRRGGLPAKPVKMGIMLAPLLLAGEVGFLSFAPFAQRLGIRVRVIVSGRLDSGRWTEKTLLLSSCPPPTVRRLTLTKIS